MSMIKRAREFLGLGPAAFGKKLGVKSSTIWRWERGDPVPPLVRNAIEQMVIEEEKKNRRRRWERVYQQEDHGNRKS